VITIIKYCHTNKLYISNRVWDKKLKKLVFIGRSGLGRGPMKKMHSDAFALFTSIRSAIVLAGDSDTNIMSVNALFSIDKRRGYASNHLRYATEDNVMTGMRKILLVAVANDAGKALYQKFSWLVVAPPLPHEFEAIFPEEDDDGYEYECRQLTSLN
jgi:hypothetical protein